MLIKSLITGILILAYGTGIQQIEQRVESPVRNIDYSRPQAVKPPKRKVVEDKYRVRVAAAQENQPQLKYTDKWE